MASAKWFKCYKKAAAVGRMITLRWINLILISESLCHSTLWTWWTPDSSLAAPKILQTRGCSKGLNFTSRLTCVLRFENRGHGIPISIRSLESAPTKYKCAAPTFWKLHWKSVEVLAVRRYCCENLNEWNNLSIQMLILCHVYDSDMWHEWIIC